MNQRSYFNNIPGFTQVLILLSLCVIGAMTFTYLSFALIKPLYGITGADTLILKASANPDLIKGDMNAINALRFIQLLSSIGAFLFPSLVFAWLKSPKGDYLKLKTKITWLHIVLGIVLFTVCQPVVSWLYTLNQQLHLPASMKAVEDIIKQSEDAAQKMTELFLTMFGWQDLVINLIVMAFIPAIAEEVLFRGVIQQMLSGWFKNVHVAIWTAAIIFSFIHFEFYGFLPRAVLGAILGYLLYYSGSLWVPIIGHAFNNGAQVLLSYLYDHHQISYNINANENLPVWLTLVSTVIFAGLFYLLMKKKTVPVVEVSEIKTEVNGEQLD